MKQEHRRGFPFSFRLLLVGICVLGEIALMLAMFFWLKLEAATIYSMFQLVGLVLAIVILNKPDTPGYKYGWILFILLVPLVGCFFYMIRGGSRVIPSVKRRMRRLEGAAAESVPQEAATVERLSRESEAGARQAAFLSRRSGYPVWEGTSVEYLAPSKVFYGRLLEELRKAEKSIYLEFFILSEGMMWDEIHTILKEKAAAGLDVRVMFDDFGSINRQYRGFLTRLRHEGIRVAVFNPIRPSVDLFMNDRNHRKIVVVDGTTAMTGSFNIGDEYIGVWQPLGEWVDSAAVLKGSGVHAFTVMFLTMWSFVNRTEFLPPPKPEPVEGEGFCLPYCDGPFDERNPAKGIYAQILHTARRYVYFVTPYLILDEETEIALKLAADSGVDVRILTPGVPDKWYVHPVTRSYYKDLIEAGIRIYEYTPGFVHSKLCVADDEVATVGSVNMDYRSFYFHFECGVWVCRNQAVSDVLAHWNDLTSRSREITSEWLAAQPTVEKLKQNVLRLFAPFM